MKFNVGIFSSSRSDVASLLPIIQSNKFFNFQLFVCGTHLEEKFGNTNYLFSNIKNLKIKKFQTIDKDLNNKGLIKSSNNTLRKLSKVIDKSNIEGLIIVGDRYEAFIAAYVATIHGLKIFHLGGGETTLGSLDDKFRDCISIFSNLHFITRPEYKGKLISLGIAKKNIIFSGDTSQEYLLKQKKFQAKEIEKKFKISLKKKNILVCYHPVTNKQSITDYEFKNILFCLKKLDSKIYNIFITSPNQDKGADGIINIIKNNLNIKNLFFIKNFGKYYYSFLEKTIFLIGNSSSGITDADILKVEAINVGDRQKGRIASDNIINSKSDKISIKKAIFRALIKKNKKFKKPISLKRNSSTIILKNIKNYFKNA
jgi:GDP/UDP-N,N'-diacetylbacillosamine 2-epimerase (hydrolysing)